MTANLAPDSQCPARVMVQAPRMGETLADALQDTFRVMDDMPTDISHALDRLREMR